MGKPSRPTRRVSTTGQKFTIRIFSEGVSTEVQYLAAWHRRYRDRIILIHYPHDGGRGPMQLVEAARAAKESDIRAQRRGGGRAPDAYWCVFDVDEHPHIPKAEALAVAHGIRVAISNPCFELWLLLHYVDHQKWDHRHDIQAAIKRVANIRKNLSDEDVEQLIEHYDIARTRAVALERMHERNATQDRNPGSNLYELVDLIKAPPKPGT